MGDDQTFAAKVLAALPEVRAKADASEAFKRWRDGHKSYNDGESTYWLVGGDQSRDADEMMLDWARLEGLVDAAALSRFAKDEPEVYR